MSTIPLPALGVQPPAPPPDPITPFMRVRQAANLGLDTQVKPGEIQSQQNANGLMSGTRSEKRLSRIAATLTRR
jgi:hypothetical protein